MTHVGNEFQETYNQMKIHGMPLPNQRVTIRIKNAKDVLKNCFSYFLSFQNAELEWQPEYDEIAGWLEDNQGRGLFLYGDCGRGKTLLSRYVLPAILLKYSRKVVTVYDAQEMNLKLDEVLKKHILSLDDIGTEEVVLNYGNKRLAFAEIMDAVEKQSKLIIVSTNLQKTRDTNNRGIIETYGERVFERIIATTKRIEFKGKSLRQ
ncbi:MAG: hypothetical protein LUG18_07380 [Candidatus Azobacteroides sp.]|nr:hypothetical protein [Candidatus Azobacteroides sp.]